MSIPYSSATSGREAMDEIRAVLQGFGCDKFAPMEDFQKGEVTIQFEYRGRMVQVGASARGYAKLLLTQRGQAARKAQKKGPWTEQAALKQGSVAVWSILRDWIKAQVTAVECGVLKFDAAFLGQILLPDGRTVHQHVEEREMLPALEAPK